jgi:acetyl-CoA carboxylase alpha subunit
MDKSDFAAVIGVGSSGATEAVGAGDAAVAAAFARACAMRSAAFASVFFRISIRASSCCTFFA